MRNRKKLAVGAAVAAAMVAVGVAQPALGAAPGQSALLPSPSSITIDLTNLTTADDSGTFSVGLDTNCPQPLNQAQSYDINVTAPAFVSVAPSGGVTGAMHCGDTRTYTVTPLNPYDATTNPTGNQGVMAGTISLAPVVSNKGNGNATGIQSKVTGATVHVSVTFPGSGGSSGGTGGDPGAAPAVANAYLNGNIADNIPENGYCQNVAKKAGSKSWRGYVISAVAQDPVVQPGYVRFTQYGVTDDPSTWGPWIQAVVNEVDKICLGS